MQSAVHVSLMRPPPPSHAARSRSQRGPQAAAYPPDSYPPRLRRSLTKMGELLLAPRINKALVNQQLEIVKADAELVEKDVESAELELQARAWCRCAALFCCSKCEKK